jgi:hypothetical protein
MQNPAATASTRRAATIHCGTVTGCLALHSGRRFASSRGSKEVFMGGMEERNYQAPLPSRTSSMAEETAEAPSRPEVRESE